MHMLQCLFCLTTALHVSDITITHLQEHKTTVTTASGNRYTILLSPIVEELELIYNKCFQQMRLVLYNYFIYLLSPYMFWAFLGPLSGVS
jgi:hypothetical protein